MGMEGKVWTRERLNWGEMCNDQMRVGLNYSEGHKEMPRALAGVWEMVRCACYKRSPGLLCDEEVGG